MLDDIEIYFLHYPTPEEAAEKWYRRSQRINWDNILFKISHRLSSTEDDIKQFAELPHPNKIIFAEKDFGSNTVIIPGISKMLADETPLTFKAFNLTGYLNQLKNTK